MDFNESKPEFELLDSGFQFKEEQAWPEIKNEPGCSQAVFEELPPVLEPELKAEDLSFSYRCSEFVVKEEEDACAEEKPPILEVEGEVPGDNQKKYIGQKYSSRFALSEKRKRMADTPISCPVSKQKYTMQPRRKLVVLTRREGVIDKRIILCFKRVQHPSATLMLDLAEKCQLTFREVFEQFEQLRCLSRTKCSIDDTCGRTRLLLEEDQYSAQPAQKANPGCSVRDDEVNEEKPPVLEAEVEGKWSHLSEKWNEIEDNSGSHQAVCNEKEEEPPFLDAEERVQRADREAETKKPRETYFHVPNEKRVTPRKMDCVVTALRTRGIFINPHIAASFVDVEDPSVKLIFKLSQRTQLTFREVFNQFEQLRRSFSCGGPRNMKFDRSRNRFKDDPHAFFFSDNRPNLRSVCLGNFFKKISLRRDISESNIQMILEHNQAQPWFTPNFVRNEWHLYRTEIYQIRNESNSIFFSDLLYFSRNAHPSVEEMIRVSKDAKVPYKKVYERFVELRYTERVTCAENDTCQILKTNMTARPSPQDMDIDVETMTKLIAQFDKFLCAASRSFGRIPLYIVHSIILSLKLPCSTIQSVYDQWMQLDQKVVES